MGDYSHQLTIENNGLGVTGGSLGSATPGTLITGSGFIEAVEKLESLRQSNSSKTYTQERLPPVIITIMWIRTS